MEKGILLTVSIVVSFVFFSCKDSSSVVDFTVKTKTLVAGEQVKFINKSSGWNSVKWYFGDGSSSSAEDSTTHYYKAKGNYLVKLQLDNNDNYVCVQPVVIEDNLPHIKSSDTTVYYYKSFIISPKYYNPKDSDVTIRWEFSENAHGDSIDDVTHKSVAVKPIVYFSKPGITERIRLNMTIGTRAYEKDTFIVVNDIKSRSLLIARKDGNILRQRIFSAGSEDYKDTKISSGSHPFNLSASGDFCFIFDAGSNVNYQSDWLTNTSGDGSLRRINLNNDAVSTLSNNSGSSSHFGFYNGCAGDNYIYWTDYSDFVYRTPIGTTGFTFSWLGYDEQMKQPYYLARVDKLNLGGLATGQFSGGVQEYDNIAFWAKGGSGKGLYRFDPSNIGAQNYSPILTAYSIRAFCIDKINQKIYFSVTAPSDKVGFWVANIDGTNAYCIDNSPMDDPSLFITGIAVDNLSGKVFWAYRCPDAYKNDGNALHRSGVKMVKLATQYTTISSKDVTFFTPDVEAYGIAIDPVEK